MDAVEQLQLPPSINDASSKACLGLLGRWDTLGVDRVLVWHTASVDEAALPFMADTYGVRDIRYVDGPARDFVRNAVAFMRTRGTPGALRRVLESMGHAGIVIDEDVRHYYDGAILHDGNWRYGAEAHWAAFVVFVDSAGPMDVERVRELWDAVTFMSPERSVFVLAVVDTVANTLTTYRETP